MGIGALSSREAKGALGAVGAATAYRNALNAASTSRQRQPAAAPRRTRQVGLLSDRLESHGLIERLRRRFARLALLGSQNCAHPFIRLRRFSNKSPRR